MGKVIGIDLGTTNSCVAVMEGSEAIVIPDTEGNRTTPSIVAFSEEGERLVGHIAKRQAITNPENTVLSAKRLIGRRFDSDEVQRFIEITSFHIVEAPNGSVRVRIRGTEYSIPEISAMVLQKMRQIAENYLDERISEAVITVPAYFDDSQRKATKDAGKIAGLEVLRVLPEPTAASLAYGKDKEKSQKIAVYDLGGGTFDISILEIGDGVIEARSVNGNSFLGGDDFDQEIIDWLTETFQQQEGIDLKSDRMALQRLKEAAEKSKCELSYMPETEISLPYITADDTGPKHLKTTLTRSKLEELTNDIVEQTFEPTRQVLEDADLTVNDIDEILMVGGQTRMPKIKDSISNMFQKEPVQDINPDEVVALGAAVQGGILKGEVKDILLIDVTPLSLGVETLGGIFSRIIPRNSAIPTKKSEIYSTAEDNQRTVSIHVLQGERELTAHNKSLGRFDLVGIPAAPRGVPQIEVTFALDANGILTVSAKELTTKKEVGIQITGTSGLTDLEIEEMIKDAESHRKEDQKRKSVLKARNDAQLLIYATQKTLANVADHLSPEEREDVDRLIEKTQDAIEYRDSDKIVSAARALREASTKISMKLFEKGIRVTAPSTDNIPASMGAADETEREFEEDNEETPVIIDDLEEEEE